MRISFTSIFLVYCLLISACATGYQAVDADGAGFSSGQVSKDSYVVAFVGNAHTSREKLHDYAMLYAAQVTIKQGYRYFLVSGEKTISFLQPPKYCAGPRIAEYFVNPEGGYNLVHNYHGNSGTRYNAVEFEIRLMNAMPATTEKSAYDADEIMRLMDKKYALNITPDSGIAKSTADSYAGDGCK